MVKNLKENKNLKKKSEKDLYGIEPEGSLQSVNFAPSENSFLNERTQGDSCDSD